MPGESSRPTRSQTAGVSSGSGSDVPTERTKLADLDRTMGADGPTAEELDQQAIGKYEVRRLLGKGGMGAVYLGFDPLIEREVAIKVLPRSLAENETYLKRFLAEARAVGKLNHPNSVAIYDIGQHDDQYYIVMELARGGSVADLLEEKERIPLGEACRIAADAARGLEAAHAVGLIHRDVKPENLMLSPEGTAKLVDFGLAKDVDRASEMAMTGAGQMLGTPFYMSPEQINGDTVDKSTDIYSLGATLYHLLTGEAPFTGDSLTQVLFAHVSAERPDPCKLDPTLPAACAKIVAKAMSIEPAQRYASMQEFMEELEKLHESTKAVAQEIRETDTVNVADVTPDLLVVEPSKLRSKVTADIFRKAGCQNIDCVASAADALQHAKSQPIDVIIASRQLGELKGEELLRQVHAAGQSDAMLVLDSSDPPHQLLMQAPLPGTAAAYVKKQAKPDETLRAVYVGANCTLLRIPFASGDRSDTRMDVVTDDGSIPSDMMGWIRELIILDVTPRPATEADEASPRNRDIIFRFLSTESGNYRFPDYIISAPAEALLKQCTTLAVVEISGPSLRLRGVRRAASIVTCDRSFDREAFLRIIDVAD